MANTVSAIEFINNVSAITAYNGTTKYVRVFGTELGQFCRTDDTPAEYQIRENSAGVTSESFKVMYSALLAASSSGNQVKLTYNNSCDVYRVTVLY